MENLFREILAPSPRLTSTDLPSDVPSGANFEASTSAAPASAFASQMSVDGILGLEGLVGGGAGEGVGDDDRRSGPRNIWTNELEVDMQEMDRILGLLPAATESAAYQQGLDDLGLGLGWGDMENMTGADSALVGVF
jgi:hypothetical protein